MSIPPLHTHMVLRPALLHLSVALLVTVASTAVYLSVVAFAGRLQTGAYGLELRLSDLVVGIVCYLLLAFDMAVLQQQWFAIFTQVTQRTLIQLGSALGTVIGKVAMFVIWQLLVPTPLLLAAMLLFAVLLLPQVATLSLASAEGRPWPRLLVRPLAALLVPLQQLLLPFAGRVVRPLDLALPATLRRGGFLLAGLAIPFATIHDFLSFVVLYPVIQIAGFGVGAIIGNSVLSLWLLIWPTGALRVLRSPLLAAPRAALLLALALCGVFRIGVVLLGPLLAG